MALWLTAGEVARRLKVSIVWVRRLDDQLKPERLANGVRVYDPAAVEAFAVERDLRKAEERSARSNAAAKNGATRAGGAR